MWALFFTLARKSLKTTYIFGRNQRKIPVDTMNLMDTWPKAPPPRPGRPTLSLSKQAAFMSYTMDLDIYRLTKERESILFFRDDRAHSYSKHVCISCKCPCVPSFVASHRLQPAWLAFNYIIFSVSK